MNWLHKARPALVVVGVLLLVGSLLGARLLAPGAGGGTDPSAAPPPAATGSGPIVLGYVDSNPRPVETGLPPVLQSGEVVEVFVRSGDEVKAGAPLYRFNTRPLEAKVNRALQTVNVALANVERARAAETGYPRMVEAQELKVRAAEEKVRATAENVRVYEANLRDVFKANPPEIAEKLFEKDPERLKLRAQMTPAPLERDAEKLSLEVLRAKAVDAAVDRKAAEAQVEEARAAVSEAKTAVELCTVRALVAGTVERVNVGPGDVIGVGTRTPAMVLVPAGPRVVRAEVEAEFAHRVGSDKIGKEVVIHDHSDPKLTYKGTVKRVGDAFLPKRSASALAPNETLVLEALVEVADPAPPGKPPLRVGQRVKVNFGPQ